MYFGATGINCASFDDLCFDSRTVSTVWNFFALFKTTVYATFSLQVQSVLCKIIFDRRERNLLLY